jgi:hypothetical protein
MRTNGTDPRATTRSAALTRSSLAPRLLAIAALLALATFVAVARGVQAQTPTATPTGTPTATGTAVGTATATPTPARRPELAPIEAVEIQILKSQPPQYQVAVTSGLPGGCAAFENISFTRSGARIDVTVMNSMPVENIPCTAIYGYHDSSVNLGSDFVAGTTYTVTVNGAGSRPMSTTFTAEPASQAPGATPTPAGPTPTPLVPQPANVGTGGVTAPGTEVEAFDAIIGIGAFASAAIALSLLVVRVPRRRG